MGAELTKLATPAILAGLCEGVRVDVHADLTHERQATSRWQMVQHLDCSRMRNIVPVATVSLLKYTFVTKE